jgi:hypothetical protein
MSIHYEWQPRWFTRTDVYKSYHGNSTAPIPISERYDWFMAASHDDPAKRWPRWAMSPDGADHGDPASAMGMSIGVSPAPTDFWKHVTEAHRQIKEDFAKKEGVDNSIREQINSDLDRQIERSVKRE